MSIIKSVSVGYGDMYYILHNSDNFHDRLHAPGG